MIEAKRGRGDAPMRGHRTPATWLQRSAESILIVLAIATSVLGTPAAAHAVMLSSWVDGIPPGWSPSDVTFNIELSMGNFRSQVTWYRIDQTDWQVYSGTPVTWSGEGAHLLSYWVNDTYNKTMEPPHYTWIRIDRSPPTSSILGIPSGVTTSDVVFTLSGSDSLSGISTLMYRLDDDPVRAYEGPVTVSRNGTTTVTWWAVDMAGNAETPHTTQVEQDLPYPVTTASVPDGWVTSAEIILSAAPSDEPISGTWFKAGSREETSYSGPFEIYDEGTTILSYASMDEGGDREPTRTAVVRVDRTPPVSHGDGLPDGWVRTATFALSGEDALSGVRSIRYSLNGAAAEAYIVPVNVIASGTNTVTWWAEDEAGNMEVPHTAVVRIDRGPVTQIAGVSSEWQNKDVEFTLTGTSDGHSISAIYYRIDSGDEKVYTGPVRLSSEGAATVTYRSVDDAGMQDLAHTATVRIDKIPPVTDCNGLPSGWSAAPVVLAFSGTDALSGLLDVSYRLNDAAEAVAIGPIEISSEGTTAIVWQGRDVAGNRESPRTATVRIDCTPPTTSVSGLPTGTVDHPVTLALSAKDGCSGVAGISYRLDAGPVLPYAGAFSISSPGTTTVSWWATDDAGNSSEARSATVSIRSPEPPPQPPEPPQPPAPPSPPVRVTLGIDANRARVRVGQDAILSGSVSPTASIGGIVRVEVRKPGKSYWSYSSARVVYAAGERAAWWYRYVFKRGMPKGIYRFRANAVVEGVRVRSGLVPVTVG